MTKRNKAKIILKPLISDEMARAILIIVAALVASAIIIGLLGMAVKLI